MPPGAFDYSYAQAQARWMAICEGQFDQDDWFHFLGAIHQELPAESLLREIGRLVVEEFENDGEERRPLVLERIANWPMTIRIDGIMPVHIPLASDVSSILKWFIRQLDTLGLDYPSLEQLGQLENDLSLCLFAWLHERCLKSDHGMFVEMSTQCPRSALSAKEELTVMGLLPNGSRITIFYSSLKGRECLTMPDAAVEHVDQLVARRDGDGILRLYAGEC